MGVMNRSDIPKQVSIGGKFKPTKDTDAKIPKPIKKKKGGKVGKC